MEPKSPHRAIAPSGPRIWYHRSDTFPVTKAASMHPVTIIFLNGVSSSGKTSIAKILQQVLAEPYLHVQLDSFEAMLPERYDEGGLFDWQVLFPKALSGFHHSIAALATAGNNLIVDHVTVVREGWHSSLIECAYLLMPFRAYLVGVHCPLSELQRREHARGDRFIGTAIRQFEHVHRYGLADLNVDTSTTTAEMCAEQVQAYVNSHEPSAFQQLRANT
jgi:chloramphenicol 3-O phosphotransferase